MTVIDESIGAFVVAGIIATYLSGIVATQCFSYYTTFQDDRRLYFWLVTGLLVLDVLHTAISCRTIYFFGVTRWGDPTALVHSPWSFSIEPSFTGIAASVVQGFYAYRVWIISARKPIIPVLIAIGSAIQLGFAIGASIKIFVFHQEFARFHEYTYGVAAWLVAASATDLLITASMVYYLKSALNSDYVHTSSLVQKILRNVIETNGLTAAAALTNMVLFLVQSNKLWHVIPQLALIKLYFNSVLVSLNSRKILSEHGNGTSHALALKSLDPALPRHRDNQVIHVTMEETVHEERGDGKDAGFHRGVNDKRK